MRTGTVRLVKFPKGVWLLLFVLAVTFSFAPSRGAYAAGEEAAAEKGGDSKAPAEDSGDTPKPSASANDEPVRPYTPRDAAKDPKDPFEAKIKPPTPVASPSVNVPQVAPKKEVPPLPIKVSCILGNDSKRVALLDLNGKSYEMEAGESEDGGLFKVIDITENGVKIFDTRVQKDRTIPLAGQ